MPVRLLLYITSHLSARHLQYMQRIWPTHVDRALFSHDVLFYAPDRAPPAFRALFTGNFTEVVAANPGYQSGAIAAVSYVQTHRERIAPYDWVLRFNPDVMIRDADWLIAAMHDASVDGIFVDCRQSGCTQRCTKALIHTDLLAFRPRSLCNTVLAADNAEWHATALWAVTVLAGRDRWLPRTLQDGVSCRVRSRDIVHDHRYLDGDIPPSGKIPEWILKNDPQKPAWTAAHSAGVGLVCLAIWAGLRRFPGCRPSGISGGCPPTACPV